MIPRLFALVSVTALALFAPPAHASTITVSDVWSRPATGTGVVYATIRNHTNKPDRLVSVSSPVAKAVELHESMPVPSAMMSPGPASSGSMNAMPGMGAMMMRPVHSITIPAGGSATLKPGGYHIMLIGLHHDLTPGEKVPLTLHFRDAGIVQVHATVRSMSP